MREGLPMPKIIGIAQVKGGAMSRTLLGGERAPTPGPATAITARNRPDGRLTLDG
jgi:hypothetical protein